MKWSAYLNVVYANWQQWLDSGEGPLNCSQIHEMMIFETFASKHLITITRKHWSEMTLPL